MKTLIFNIDPCPAPRMTQSDKWNKRKCVVKYHAFRTEFILKCNILGYTLQPELDITFVLPMPKSWPNYKWFQFDGLPHQQKPDIDNVIKSVMDSFGKDDGFVHSVNANKIWGQEGKIIIRIK